MKDGRNPTPPKKVNRASLAAPHLVPRGEFFPDRLEFDLFGYPLPSPKTCGTALGRGSRSKSPELTEAVKRLAAAGLTRLMIAQQLGIAESTLYQNYFLEIGVRHGCPGRRTHAPSTDQRRLVALRTAEGVSSSAIAAELGLSPPTLRKHYRAELGRSNAAPTDLSGGPRATT